MDSFNFFACCVGNDRKSLFKTEKKDVHPQGNSILSYPHLAENDVEEDDGGSFQPHARKKKKKKKKKRPLDQSIKREDEERLRMSPTPGEPLLQEEEIALFNHEYYEKSMKIIELMFMGKAQQIPELNLEIEIYLNKVFYEEPLGNDAWLEDQYGDKTDLEWRKSTEKKEFLKLLAEGNQSEQLYLVDSQWIIKWAHFLKSSKAHCNGEIMNDKIYSLISSGTTLKLGEDVFVVSERLWNSLYDWYGGGPTLKWQIEVEEPPAQISSRPQQIMPVEQVDYKVQIPTLERRLKLPYEEIIRSKSFVKSATLSNNKSTTHSNGKSSSTRSTPNKERFAKSRDQKQPRVLDTRHQVDISDLAINSKNKISRMESSTSLQQIHSYRTRRPSLDSEEEILEQGTLLRVFGLENNNLYCYLNSVLQCLLSIHHFRDFYISGAYRHVKIKDPIIKDLKFSQFMELITLEVDKVALTHKHKVIRTTSLKNLIRNKFSAKIEHDSHEFLLYFLNNLKEEMTEKEVKLPDMLSQSSVTHLWKSYIHCVPSLVDKLFTLIERTSIKCKSCHQSAHSLQFYLAFPLQVEGLRTITQSFNVYSKSENMQDYKCEYCELSFKSDLTRHIIKIPEVFILQLQRFATYPRMRKIRGLLEYPEYLDMSQFLSPEINLEQCNNPSMYELQAVIVHVGSFYGGHYKAYVKKENNQWYCMNDERASKVSINEVLGQDAYLLFYQKVENKLS